MAPDGNVARKETTSLISSDKVEGTSVYDPAGNKLGSIHSVMIGKMDGKVAYAVLSFGGFLGMGTDHYPIPWERLRYDTRLDGYVTDLSKAQLEGAPKYTATEAWTTDDRRWATDVDGYYAGPRFPAL
ncbi:PRC-barrel domain-containing protein [Acetobacteraceae bacterium H6797]|nr:PRC-barrel domain-containing protein [Acetobacteraceae bacterium H6797]